MFDVILEYSEGKKDYFTHDLNGKSELTFDFGDGNGPVAAHKHNKGNGWVADTAQVDAITHVSIGAVVFGNAKIIGQSFVCNKSRIYGDAEIDNATIKNAIICGVTKIYKGSTITNGKHFTSPFYIKGSRHPIVHSDKGKLSIGCIEKTYGEWLYSAEKIGEKYGYSAEEIKEYRELIKYAGIICEERENISKEKLTVAFNFIGVVEQLSRHNIKLDELSGRLKVKGYSFSLIEGTEYKRLYKITDALNLLKNKIQAEMRTIYPEAEELYAVYGYNRFKQFIER